MSGPTTLILCGGRGTRAYPHTVDTPKPLIEVGDRPVVRHVMDIYAAQGFTDFVLAAGYKAELIAGFARTLPPEWNVTVRDTGVETNTGARVAACSDLVTDPFFVTYADGLADIDLQQLLAFHRGHEGHATLTTVPLPSPFGTVDANRKGQVVRFAEKPRLDEHQINAGFLVFDAAVFAQWTGEDLEREVLPMLSEREELFAYRHLGFWRSLDSYKDALALSELWDRGDAPWVPRAAAS